MKKYQHGDVLIKQLSEPIKTKKIESYGMLKGQSTDLTDTNERWMQDNRVVIAEGEVTGHAHAFNFDINPNVKITLFKSGESYSRNPNSDTPDFMRIENGPATITHEEHDPIQIPSGDYSVSQVREFDYLSLEARRVVD
jgi:hypothetical protein|tara:strand:- start:1276 stop:1692 length:417 start_codon:yes stop_codon:yes gene_type:complete